ncbi:hypothetical protein MHYP_G00252430 [Metynnis hypsauchen]
MVAGERRPFVSGTGRSLKRPSQTTVKPRPVLHACPRQASDDQLKAHNGDQREASTNSIDRKELLVNADSADNP